MIPSRFLPYGSPHSFGGNVYKILVTGDRNWKDEVPILHLIKRYTDYYGFASVMVIHGLARGADLMASHVATKLFANQHGYPAEWDRFGKSAGVKRNQLMLDMNRDIHICIAFHDDLASSRGTADMVRRALKAGITVYNVHHLSIEDHGLTEERGFAIDLVLSLKVGRKPETHGVEIIAIPVSEILKG